ncbi:glycosyltransferase, partial [Flavobacteriaceae bacterium]|nr:glycosyltransferase [Flavobacteriaceae bacterium]
NTLEIIKSFNSPKIKWISEPDKGISDAFNKGIRLATGDYINFQGDGDGFINNNSINHLFSNLDLKERPIVCGNIQRIDIQGNILYKTQIKKRFDKKSLLFKMSLPHQGLFIPKEFFAKHGKFDLNNKYCMDYELLLRSYNNFPKVIIRDLVVSNWRADGLGEGKTLEILKEYHKIKLKNKVASKSLLVVIHIYSIFKYYLKSFFKNF